MATKNIVKFFFTKGDNGFSTPSYLGAEQYFVSPLRGSSNNNLEEQYLMGVDCITTSWTTEEGVDRVTKEFYNIQKENPNNYYILEIYNYNTNTNIEEYIGMVDGIKSFIVDENNGTVENNELTLDNINLYSIDSDDNIIINPNNVIVQKAELYFVGLDNERTLVSTRLNLRTTFEDGTNKVVEKSFIVNHLT